MEKLKFFFYGFIFCLIVFLAIKHFQIDEELYPIKEEFKKVAETSQAKEVVSDNAETVYLDYDGKIDTIIRKRNDFLKNKPFLMIGSWFVMDREGYTYKSIYLYFPFK